MDLKSIEPISTNRLKKCNLLLRGHFINSLYEPLSEIRLSNNTIQFTIEILDFTLYHMPVPKFEFLLHAYTCLLIASKLTSQKYSLDIEFLINCCKKYRTLYFPYQFKLRENDVLQLLITSQNRFSLHSAVCIRRNLVETILLRRKSCHPFHLNYFRFLVDRAIMLKNPFRGFWTRQYFQMLLIGCWLIAKRKKQTPTIAVQYFPLFQYHFLKR